MTSIYEAYEQYLPLYPRGLLLKKIKAAHWGEHKKTTSFQTL